MKAKDLKIALNIGNPNKLSLRGLRKCERFKKMVFDEYQGGVWNFEKLGYHEKGDLLWLWNSDEDIAAPAAMEITGQLWPYVLGWRGTSAKICQHVGFRSMNQIPVSPCELSPQEHQMRKFREYLYISKEI